MLPGHAVPDWNRGNRISQLGRCAGKINSAIFGGYLKTPALLQATAFLIHTTELQLPLMNRQSRKRHLRGGREIQEKMSSIGNVSRDCSLSLPAEEQGHEAKAVS